MSKTGKIVWGVILIAVGLIFGLNALGLTDIHIFFDGWWTLFIIIPCAVGLFREQEKTGNLIGLTVGILLLLWRWGIVELSVVWKLIGPAIIVLIGAGVLSGALRGDRGNQVFNKMITDGKTPKVGCAAFSGCDMNFDGQVFEGADLTAVFGGIECDLRTALLENDCAIKVCAVFGGIDILVPEDVQVRISTTSVFGGVTNKAKGRKDAPITLYVSGICLFGGVDIK